MEFYYLGESMACMEFNRFRGSMNSMESKAVPGIHQIHVIPKNFKESMKILCFLGIPWIPWYILESIDFDKITSIFFGLNNDIHGMLWNPWVCMDFYGLHGIPWNPFTFQETHVIPWNSFILGPALFLRQIHHRASARWACADSLFCLGFGLCESC